MNIEVVRFAYLPECTLSYWYVGEHVFAGIGEPWRADPDGPGGQRRENGFAESCIPDGLYTLRPHVSNKHPKERYVWCLINEALGVYPPGGRPAGQRWGRDAILAHAGATVADTLGCELIGLRHEIRNGKYAVVDSQKAMAQLREILGWEKHMVLIRHTAGTLESLHGRTL